MIMAISYFNVKFKFYYYENDVEFENDEYFK